MIVTPASAQPFTVGAPGDPQLLYGASDPDTGAGVPAPVCSIYAQTTDGVLWRKVGALDTEWEVLGGGNPTNGWFGTGQDGAHTVVGTETLTGDVQYTTLLVPNGAVLIAAARIFATVSVTVEAGGAIRANGATATTSSAGAGFASVSMANGTSGSAGATGAAGNVADSTNQPLGMQANATEGGDGGSGANAGGTGGDVSAFAAARGNPPWWGYQAIRTRFSSVTGSTGAGLALGTAGLGGGGGGGSGVGNLGGGGGGGGGTVMISSPVIVNDGAIEARGGNGAPGQSGNSGGGGGGGGGKIFIVGDFTGNAPDVSGGTGGASSGGGTNGQDGQDGFVVIVPP